MNEYRFFIREDTLNFLKDKSKIVPSSTTELFIFNSQAKFKPGVLKLGDNNLTEIEVIEMPIEDIFAIPEKWDVEDLNLRFNEIEIKEKK